VSRPAGSWGVHRSFGSFGLWDFRIFGGRFEVGDQGSGSRLKWLLLV
jgi:hypothetical protein